MGWLGAASFAMACAGEALPAGAAGSIAGTGTTSRPVGGIGATAVATTPVATTPDTPMAEFVAAADAVCIATILKVDALPDPDGVGGHKQPGLGRVVREWADGLAAIDAPNAIEDDWLEAMRILRLSGTRLDDAERLAAAGDPRSGEAQSEALWELQPRASEIIAGLAVPFAVCFVE